MKKLFNILVYLTCLTFVFCQNVTEVDSTSIMSFTDKVFFKFHLDTEIDSYKATTDNNPDLHINTNNQYKFVISVDYDFFGASIGFSPKFIPGNNDNDLKGESSFSDYSFRFFPGKWIQKIQYKKTLGYYIENTHDFIPNWIENEDAYIQLSDFKTTYWGGATSYIFNPDFSLKNVIYNSEWQRKSSGSFTPSISYGYLRLSSTSGGVKSYENNFEVKLSPSYYYTLVVHKNWFTSLEISPAVALRFTKEGKSNSSTTNTYTRVPFSINGGLQIGYSSEKIIFGAKCNLESNYYNESHQTHITNDIIFTTVYLGFRLTPPKAVKKIFDKAHKKTGI